MKKINLFTFFAIIIIAIFFRFYQINTVPSHPTLDEVSIGYNAYSILTTGKDEFGMSFPVLLRAYDDYRPALYAYLVIPFVKLFGLSIESVRFPSVILSVLAVISMYFITREIIPKKNRYAHIISLFVMFLAAISPWSVYISRLGHEANAGFAFFIFGLLFFLRFVNASKIWKYNAIQLILSSVFFALSFSSYQSQKLFIPLFVCLLGIIFFKKLLSAKKTCIVSLIIGVFIALPVFASSFSDDALIRFSGTNVFESNHPVLSESIRRIEINNGNENIFQKVFDNRRVGIFLVFTQAFLSHFNPVWLTTNAGFENFKAPDFGVFSLSEALLILFGIFYLFKNNTISRRIKIVFLGWLVFSILPAAITTDYPHAMRVMTVLFLPQIIAGFGLLFFLEKVKPAKLVIAVVVVIFSFNTLWFYHAYFINFKIEQSYRFQHGVLEALKEAKRQEKNFDEIVVSNQGVLRASSMYYLFHDAHDPRAYQNSGQNENGRFDTERKIGKYYFTNVSKTEIKGSPLFIIAADSLPRDNFDILKTIYYLDGSESIWVAVRR